MSINEEYFEVRKTARYYWLGNRGPDVHTIWFVCHGYRQLAKFFVRHFEVLNDGSTLVVAPEGFHRFYINEDRGRVGASWMTKEDRLTDIKDYVRYLDQLYSEIMEGRDRTKIKVVVLGFSQGAATVCRWMSQSSHLADHLLIWAGTFPPDLDLTTDPEGFRGLDIKMMVGDSDPYVVDTGLISNQKAFLEQNEIPYELLHYEGDHRIVPAFLKKVAKGL